MLNTTLLLLNEPVETVYGYIKPLPIREYLKLESQLRLLSMRPLHMYYAHLKASGNTLRHKELKELEKLKEIDLYEYIFNDQSLLYAYTQIIYATTEFKEGSSFHAILETKENFYEFRDIIMKMNFLKEEKVYKNKELQDSHEISMKLKNKGDGSALSDIITTVVLHSPYTFETIPNISMLQLYALYLQIAQEKDYDTSTLFATVSSEAKIEHWSKHVDLFKEVEQDIKHSDFIKKTADVF